jgi:hypothetical protein
MSDASIPIRAAPIRNALHSEISRVRMDDKDVSGARTGRIFGYVFVALYAAVFLLQALSY